MTKKKKSSEKNIEKDKKIITTEKNILSIDAPTLKQMFLLGGEEISNNYKKIDELNVFPVPDGDTGTNLKLTTSGASDVIKNNEYNELFTLCKQYARALLMNARGNSGVIFSQIIKGFVSGIVDNQKEINIEQLINCFHNAVRVAYNAVSNPVEGTILTVIRVTSEELIKNKKKYKNVNELLTFAIEEAEKILLKTPELLPELKEAKVVDSGGYGLVRYLIGMRKALLTEKTNDSSVEKKLEERVEKMSIVGLKTDTNDGFGYCTEFIFTIGTRVHISQKEKDKFDEKFFKKEISGMGDSIVLVVDDKKVKVHIHTIKPYQVLYFASRFGEFDKVKIENMTNQFLEKNPGTTLEDALLFGVKEKRTDDVKIIVSVPTLILGELFVKQLGVDEYILEKEGGNSSIKNFVSKLLKVKSNKIIVLLENSNEILAIKEAIKLLPPNVNVHFFNAGSIANIYMMCLAFVPMHDFNTNIKTLDRVF
jgi:DAK2 domain fusion protein YloV